MKRFAMWTVIAAAVLVIVVSTTGCTSPSNKTTATSLRINEYDSSIEATLGPYGSTGGQTVYWFINDQPKGNNTTNSKGEVFFPLKSLPNDLTFRENYTVRVEFKGDSTLSPSTCSTTLAFSTSKLDIYNQTVGLVTSSTFPSLSNATRFPGGYLDFEVSTKDPTWQKMWSGYRVHDPCTVFLVRTTKLEKTGNYIGTGTAAGLTLGSGYRGQFDIYVVKYPEKTPIGKYTIISNPPQKSSGFGDEIGNKADWYTWIKEHTTGDYL